MSNGKTAVDEVIRLLVVENKSFSADEVMKKAQEVGRAIKENGTEKTKLREYFGQVKSLATALKAGTKTLDQARIELYKMKARIAYDTQRQGENKKTKRPKLETLKKLVDLAVEKALKEGADLKKEVIEFSDFFECVMGYYTFEDKKEVDHE